MRRLAKQGVWPASYWQGFLWHLAEPRERKGQPARLHDHVAGILAEAPDGLFNEIGSAVAGFVSRLAEEYGNDREDDFGLLWMKAWIEKGDVEPETVDLGDPLTDALNHPAGKLARQRWPGCGSTNRKSERDCLKRCDRTSMQLAKIQVGSWAG